MARVELIGVHKRFGETEVLRDVTLDLADGAFVVFVGPSGCGKTTLLRCIAGRYADLRTIFSVIPIPQL